MHPFRCTHVIGQRRASLPSLLQCLRGRLRLDHKFDCARNVLPVTEASWRCIPARPMCTSSKPDRSEEDLRKQVDELQRKIERMRLSGQENAIKRRRVFGLLAIAFLAIDAALILLWYNQEPSSKDHDEATQKTTLESKFASKLEPSGFVVSRQPIPAPQWAGRWTNAGETIEFKPNGSVTIIQMDGDITMSHSVGHIASATDSWLVLDLQQKRQFFLSQPQPQMQNGSCVLALNGKDYRRQSASKL